GSQVQQKNAAKHLLNLHNDTRTLHKYVRCELCGGLFLKHKLTPHVRKAHGAQPPGHKAGGTGKSKKGRRPAD
ncbi:MAG: hypothetical protein ACAI44_36500, partial [Candidatus Sericytochromatia bacterium]